MCLPFGIRYSLRLVALVRRLDGDAALVLVVLPNRTVPPISAMIAASFGRRASNSSATRGRPPVMSRVLALSVGMRAMHVARLHLAARIDRDDGVDREQVARVAAAGELEDLAVLALITIAGRRSAVARTSPCASR